MNKFFLLIGLLTILVSCGNDEVVVGSEEEIVLAEPSECHCEDLLQDLKKNVFYLNTSNHPFSGKCFKNHPDKSRMIERVYVNGKIDGVVSEWHPNGIKKSDQAFSKNLAQGISNQWDENGVLTYSAHYTNGKLDSVLVNVPPVVEASESFE